MSLPAVRSRALSLLYRQRKRLGQDLLNLAGALWSIFDRAVISLLVRARSGAGQCQQVGEAG
jgi:hypothetical protein